MLKEKEDDQEICKAPSPSPEERKFSKDLELDPMGSQRVYKKTSSNQLLTLYLGSRELVARKGVIEPLRGVLYIDPKIINDAKIYGQLTLTFRYGREDEEVMGLKFCNEAVIALQNIWPRAVSTEPEVLTPLQEALLDRLGKNAVPFTLEIGTVAPPSVQLLPAKRYTGAPIGTSYDVRVYTAEASADERVQRRSTVRLGIRLIHKICPETSKVSALETATVNAITDSGGQRPKSPPITVDSPSNSSCTVTNPTTPTSTANCTINSSGGSGNNSTIPRSLRLRLSPKSLKLSSLHRHSSSVDSSNGGIKSFGDHGIIELTDVNKGPQVSVDKPFLWADGRVNLKASLNKAAYVHGENVTVTLDIKNDSRKVVRKIRLIAVQHVDVCMFSNGKFKNIVAEVDVSKHIGQGDTLHASYSLLPVRGTTKNWIAVEGALFSSNYNDPSSSAYNSKLATSAPRGLMMASSASEEKNVFAIYVSYYVKVKIILSSMGGEVSLKLPFVLGNVELNESTDGPATLSGLRKQRELNRKMSSAISNGSNSLDLGPVSPLVREMSLRDTDDDRNDRDRINRITELNNQNKRMPNRSVSESSPNRMSQPAKDNGTSTRREMFKNSKFNENLNSTIDVITEDFQNIAANISNLVKSDSSKSNLNDSGPCQQEISVEAQIHCPQVTDDGLAQH
ncbi:arrestin homolog [Malaya genurostris]|uniref:arrestin homolog n=1 Tax=Malaya genurostris TaxID=325434 RepID=UPI0026F37F4E|nr:arrestin homolog [Malaya genurostris]XP_058448501.1 arrestin homolog [Malaya genurostris]XP_058448502.1 arrestin homolog [Malaya genurostris]